MRVNILTAVEGERASENSMTRWRAWGISATAALLAAVSLIVVRWAPPMSTPAARADVTLVYVGAEDCAPCRAWQGREGKQFLGSAEFARLTYREVKSPTARDVLKDEYWPGDLRGYRDGLGAGVGVPLWLVISDEKLVERGFGAAQWRAAVLPRLKSLLH
jgi:hypothetical protein